MTTPAELSMLREENGPFLADVFDRRIAKDIDSDGDGNVDSGEHLVYDGQHIALTFDDSGSLTNRYLYGPAVDQVFASEDGAGDVLWPLADNQGTVRDIAAYDAVNDITSVINHIHYDSFGNVTSETDPQTSQAPTQGSVLDGDFPFGFTGREYDPETGQYYYRRRYYDPATGRFDSEDPLTFAAGDTNLQRYVFNSPTNYTDPSGLQAASGGGDRAVVPYRMGDLRRHLDEANQGFRDFLNNTTVSRTVKGAILGGGRYTARADVRPTGISGTFETMVNWAGGSIKTTAAAGSAGQTVEAEFERTLPNGGSASGAVKIENGDERWSLTAREPAGDGNWISTEINGNRRGVEEFSVVGVSQGPNDWAYLGIDRNGAGVSVLAGVGANIPAGNLGVGVKGGPRGVNEFIHGTLNLPGDIKIYGGLGSDGGHWGGIIIPF